MFDQRLRETKEQIFAPFGRRLGGVIGPMGLTATNLAFTLISAALAAFGWRWLAVGAWLVGRLCDGLDGVVARDQSRQTDLGGYLDIMADTVGYAAVPFGVAVFQDNAQVWMWCAVLLGAFYVNTMSWTYLAAIAEKRSRGAAAQGESTTVHMPTGLIEGAETIVFFVVFLGWPSLVEWWFAAMAALVIVTVVQRMVWATRNLR